MSKNKKQMAGVNDNLSELVYIIDRSGSMGGLESDTIGGFNANLNAQRKAGGDANVSVVLFDNKCEVLVDRKPLSEVEGLNEETYTVRGCTALLDAIGGAVHHIDRVQGYMPDGHKAGHVIFTIITDGMENASSNYTYPQVKKMIEKAEKKGWEFIFLGANIDAAAEAGRLGIREDRAATYLSDSEGTAVAYEAAAEAMCAMREAPLGKRISGKWVKRVHNDTAARG